MRRNLKICGPFVCAALLALQLPAVSASASTRTPSVPHVARIVAVSATSFTVLAKPTAYATGYRVFASITKSNVYVANIARAHRSATARSTRVAISGLHYVTGRFWYRLEALNGSKHRWDTTIHSVGLRPSTPTGVRITSSSAGTSLTWNSRSGTGYGIVQATNTGMTQNRRRYVIRGANTQFTPYGLVRGLTYYFRVQSINVSSGSVYSLQVRATARSAEQPLNVVTYNVLEADTAGTHEGGQLVAAWSKRRPGVVALIRKANPDVIAVQEAAAWTGTTHGYGGTRQIDDLRRALGNYSLAHTEVPPSQHGYFRTGNYVLYRTATYRAVGAGGHWAVGDSRFAAYQELRNRTSGAALLAVSPHLGTGSGSAADSRREAETKRLLQYAGAFARAAHLPVVYGGDFNSDVNRNHAFDGPGIAMRAAHVAEAQNAAQSLTNAQYNSANQYLRTPPAFGQSIDYIFASPGMGVRSRAVLLNLTHGKFVGPIPSDHNPVQAKLTLPY